VKKSVIAQPGAIRQQIESDKAYHLSLMVVTLCAFLFANVRVSSWIVPWNPESLASLEANGKKLTEVLPEWILVNKDGVPERAPQWTPELKKRLFTVAKANKITVLGMASNYANEKGDFESDRLSKMFIIAEKRADHIKTLVSIAVADGLDGIDLDYESMKEKDRAPFSAFVADLAIALHKAKKKLSVTIHPKTEEPGNWDGPKAQDYRAIGKAADVVRIMCYDYSHSGSDAGPIAPTDWVAKVIDFAKSQIPASKLELGVPCYGYDWTTKPGKSITFKDVKMDPAPDLDPRSGELLWATGKIRFGGSKSAEQKMKLAQTSGIRGITTWYLGSEQPSFWDLVSAKK